MNQARSLGRTVEIFTLGVVVAGAGYLGAFVSHWKERQPSPVAALAPAPAYNPPHSVPGVNPLEPRDPRQPEPQAVAARAHRIRRDLKAVQPKGVTWDEWQKQTATYREALRTRVASLRQYQATIDNDYPDSQHEPLAPLDDFPLVQSGAGAYITYLFKDDALAEFRRQHLVNAVKAWLAAKGIDLIYVPVPSKTEVYLEHFLQPCPPDGVINPNVRRTLAELLAADIETVDGARLFRAIRDADDREYLFNTADGHWAPQGIRVMAKEVADRIARYKFGARARYALPITKTEPGALILGDHLGGMGGFLWDALLPEQKRRAEAAQTTTFPHVFLRDGRALPDNPESPVLVIGNSFVEYFREALAHELNLLVLTRRSSQGTTEFFGDFIREPELLEHCRVVVWVTTWQHMTEFKPLPAPILAAGR
jgi:hypothetical protein